MAKMRLTQGGPPNYTMRCSPAHYGLMVPAEGFGSSGGAPTPGNDGTLRVLGGKLVNGSGASVVLRGGVAQGLDYVWSSGGGDPWGGSGTPNYARLKFYGGNCIRFQITAQSWLKSKSDATYLANAGSSVYDLTSGNAWGTSYNPDPNGNYAQFLIDNIAQAQAQGIFCILDIQGSAPDVTIGGVTHHMSPNGAMPGPDLNTKLCAVSLANTFGNNVAPPTSTFGPISNKSISFNFNEPHFNTVSSVTLSTTNGGSNNLSAEQILLNGGWCNKLPYAGSGGNSFVTQWWPVHGYQEICTAVRATGATNVWFWEGNSNAAQTANAANFMPTDSAKQSVCSAHWYGANTGSGAIPAFPETGSSLWVSTWPESGSASSACFNPAAALQASGVPVAILECGGQFGPACGTIEPMFSNVLAAVDKYGFVGVIAFPINPVVSSTASGNLGFFMNSGGNVVPVDGVGVVFCNWMQAHAP